MAIDLQVTEEDMQESESTPTLREGYIGPVELVNVEETELGSSNVLRFTFEAQDEDHIGQQFEHIEWEPNQQDLETEDENGTNNVEIQLRRMVHMLKRLLNTDEQTIREQVVLFQGETLSEAWNSLRTRVLQAYEKFGTTEETVHAKAFARVNNEGYVNVQFGKYPGFIRVVGRDPKLEFTQWERDQNQEARQALESSPDGTDEFNDDFDDFDDDSFDADF